MPLSDIGLARTLRAIAASVAIIVAVSLPLGYWLVVYNFEARETSNDAEAHAELVTKRINADPELWRFEIPRLEAVIATRSVTDDLPEKHYILDERGAVLAQGAQSLSPPILTRSAPLLDLGTVVGRFVTSRSLVPLLQDTALVALFGLVLALAIYVSLSLLPLRALRRTLGALDQERVRLRAIVDNAVEGIITFDLQGKLQSLNPAARRMFDYSAAELVGRSAGDLLPEIDMANTNLAGRQAHLGTQETVGRRKDGSRFSLELALSQATLDGKPQLIAIAHDVTERKEAEARIAHLNRVYAVLSDINTLIVRVRDRDELFREACRVAVKAGGFRMSLIAIVDRSVMKIVPVASAGVDEELLNAIKGMLSSDESARNTMIARAVRDKKAVVSNVSQSDPQALLGKKHAEAGVRSLAVLPLMIADEAVGILALYANESEFFHEEEMKLLTQLAGDIAFAIDHLDKQERLDYLAYYDVLTGLANRTLFLERVAQYMRSAVSGGHKLALFLIDLERFKNINDSLGRPAGDALLRQMAQWLTHIAGDANLLARMDADHFAAVLPEVK